MHIRHLQAQDLDALLQLYTQLHAQDDPLPEQKAVDAVWQEALSNPCCRYFGVFEADRLIASCTLVVIPNLTRGCRSYGLIENVVTHAEFRGRGHGKAVLAHALAVAWSANCYKVMLMTGRKDEATLRFYESAGFDRHSKQAFVAKPPA